MANKYLRKGYIKCYQAHSYICSWSKSIYHRNNKTNAGKSWSEFIKKDSGKLGHHVRTEISSIIAVIIWEMENDWIHEGLTWTTMYHEWHSIQETTLLTREVLEESMTDDEIHTLEKTDSWPKEKMRKKNSMEHGSWEAYSRSASQEIPHPFWNLTVHCRIHKSLSLVPILSHMNPVTPSYLRLGLPSCLFPSGVIN
jgi:hypothetical protein